MKVLVILFPVHIVSTSFTYSFHILTILFPHPSHIIVILFTYGFHKGKNKKHFHNLIFNCNSSSIHKKVCWSVGPSVCWSVSHRKRNMFLILNNFSAKQRVKYRCLVGLQTNVYPQFCIYQTAIQLGHRPWSLLKGIHQQKENYIRTR